MIRPATRGDLPTETDINRLAAYPGIVGQTMQAALLAADMEREVACTWLPLGSCDRAADWMGRGKCPHCGGRMFKAGAATTLCDPHRTRLFAEAARLVPGMSCLLCSEPLTLAELHAAFTWTRL